MNSTIQSLLGPTARLVGLAACLVAAPLLAQTTVTSLPVGVVSADLPSGESGLAFPLIGEDVFVGIVSGNSETMLAFPETNGDIGSLLTPGGRYYVEVVAGALEGERLDVDTAATITAADSSVALSVGDGAHSTLFSLGVDVLSDARVVLRPHVTLASLQEMFVPTLVGGANPGSADGVRIFDGSNHVLYLLRPDGETWSEQGSDVDVRNMVIPPDVSVSVRLRSGSKTWIHEGIVRTNAFRKNLVAGVQAFASGYPQDLSPFQIGGFVDPGMSADVRWTGGGSHDVADWFERAGGGSMPNRRYFLEADGESWRRVNDSTNVANAPILAVTDMWLLRRINSDPGYLILRPFDL